MLKSLVYSTLLIPLLTGLPCRTALAQAGIELKDDQGNSLILENPDRSYLHEKLLQLDLDEKSAQCHQRALKPLPQVSFRQLIASLGNMKLYINVAEDATRSENMVIYSQTTSSEGIEYYDCKQADILMPVLAIMTTAKYPADDGTAATRRGILAHNSQLTSLEPSQLGLRWDSDDAFTSKPYMDFTVSIKYPLFPLVTGPKLLKDTSSELAALILHKQPILIQPFLSFTGRFSQYVGTRDSSPVVARSFNPSLFFRFWTSRENWFDFGYAHESNGQSVDLKNCALIDPLSKTSTACYLSNNFDRGTISRGWDYLFTNWQGSLAGSTEARIQLKQFLRHGLFQGPPEEYSVLEDNGTDLKPRRQYDGIDLSLQYDLPAAWCYDNAVFCAQSIQLTQQTGIATPFGHNTTIADVTFKIGLVPVQLWVRSGYNKDLVDYYRYSNSWGFGLKLRTP